MGFWGGLGQNPRKESQGGVPKCAFLCTRVRIFGGGPKSRSVSSTGISNRGQKRGVQICAFLCIFVHFSTPPRGGSPGGPGGVLGGSRGSGGMGGGDGLNSSPSLLVEVGHSSRRTDRPCDQSSICSIAHKTWSAIVAETKPLASKHVSFFEHSVAHSVSATLTFFIGVQ